MLMEQTLENEYLPFIFLGIGSEFTFNINI